VDGLRLVVKDVSSGAVFLTFNQTLNGIDVFNGQIKLTLNAAGEVAHASADEVVPHLSLSTSPRLSADEAVRAAFQSIGIAAPVKLSMVAAPEGKVGYGNPQGDRFTPITADLAIFPMTASSARPAYRIFLEADRQSWYEILIDAESGALLFRHNLYVAAQARVWIQSPLDTTRQLTPLPSAWIPSGGMVTTGNNTDTFLDLFGEDQPDAYFTNASLNSGRAFSSTQVFDFPFTSGVDPRPFQAAAVTNLFYFVNTAHELPRGAAAWGRSAGSECERARRRAPRHADGDGQSGRDAQEAGRSRGGKAAPRAGVRGEDARAGRRAPRHADGDGQSGVDTYGARRSGGGAAARGEGAGG
jgi:hypothetical protein